MAGWDGGEGAKGGNPRFEVKSEALVTQLFLTLCDPVDCQAPLSMEFSRQDYWRGGHFFFFLPLTYSLTLGAGCHSSGWASAKGNMARFPGVATGSWGCLAAPPPAASSPGRDLPPSFLVTLGTTPKRGLLGDPSLTSPVLTVSRLGDHPPNFISLLLTQRTFLCSVLNQAEESQNILS